MDTITITKIQLKAELLRWEIDNREGRCATPEETAAKTPEQVAAENADHLWVGMAATLPKLPAA